MSVAGQRERKGVRGGNSEGRVFAFGTDSNLFIFGTIFQQSLAVYRRVKANKTQKKMKICASKTGRYPIKHAVQEERKKVEIKFEIAYFFSQLFDTLEYTCKYTPLRLVQGTTTAVKYIMRP